MHKFKLNHFRHMGLLTCVASCLYSSAAYSVCVQPPPKIHWTSVDNQAAVEMSDHIFISYHSADIIVVSLDSEELVPEEVTPYYARYVHPPDTQPGSKKLVVTLNHSDAALYGFEPLVTSYFYTLVQDATPQGQHDVKIIGTEQSTAYKDDTTCAKIFTDAHCFDTGDPDVYDLQLSSSEHPYLIEQQSTRAGEVEWHSAGLYPGRCMPPIDRRQGQHSCLRVVTLDRQGQRHEGPTQCDVFATDDAFATGQENSSCSTAAPRPSEPLPCALWIGVAGLCLWRRKRG